MDFNSLVLIAILAAGMYFGRKILMAFADILAQMQVDSDASAAAQASEATALSALSADVSKIVADFKPVATPAQLAQLQALDTASKTVATNAAANAAASAALAASIKAVDPNAP